MIKILQYNLNNRAKQRVIKPVGVYMEKPFMVDYKIKLAKKHKVNPVDIYITHCELSPQQIKAIKNNRKKVVNLKKTIL